MGRPIRIAPNFSMETLKARRLGIYVLQTLRYHRYKPWLVYPAKLSVNIDGENKIFHDKPDLNKARPTGNTRRKTSTQGS